jgi:hypothetical protein
MGGHWGTAGALAAKAISRIPVVFPATGDPLSLGLVTSLALPAAISPAFSPPQPRQNLPRPYKL